MRTKIIAEAGSNHTGNIEIAKEMIKVAARCGADYIKFQSWQAKNLKPNDPNYDRHRKAELSDEDHYVLIDECKKHKINFLTSCFDIKRIDFLAGLGTDIIKVPSPEFMSLTMIKLLKEKFKHLILSTGAVTLKEIEETMKILKGGSFTLLHCVSIYPLPLDKVNLARMLWLKRFTDSVGFSDHTLGTEASKVAITMGADYIEKHFTIDRNLPGKDQPMSATPEEIKEICDYVKLVENIKGQETYDMFREEMELRKNYIGKWGDNR